MSESLRGPSPKSEKKENVSRVNRIFAAADLTVSNCFKKLVSKGKKKCVKDIVEMVVIGFTIDAVVFTALHAAGLYPKPNDDIKQMDLSKVGLDFDLAETTGSSGELGLSLQLQDLRYQPFGDIEIVVDEKTNLPVKYISPDGKEVILDQEKIGKIKERAIVSGEPEIITEFMTIDEQQGNFQQEGDNYSLEHPEVLELPGDVLSEEELLAKGIFILQPESTNLSIRKSAFEEDGPLVRFSDGSKKLNIILIDGGVLDEKYLNDPKYSDLIKCLPEESKSVKNYRNFLINHQVKILNNSRVQLKDLQNQENVPKEQIDVILNQILTSKLKVFEYSKTFSDDQIRHEGHPEKGGEYLPQEVPTPTVVIFLNNPRSFRFEPLYFDSTGRVALGSYGQSKGSSINSEQTYPNPNDFQINKEASPDNPKSYPYGGISPGFALRHELTHDLHINDNVDEYNTDMEAMQGISQAWNKWKDSGYTDNGGYCFVFSLSKEQGGGYILTENLKDKFAKNSSQG
jgi:hypothetical protein